MSARTFEVQTFDYVYTLDPHRAFDGSSRHAVVNFYDDVGEDGTSRRPWPTPSRIPRQPSGGTRLSPNGRRLWTCS